MFVSRQETIFDSIFKSLKEKGFNSPTAHDVAVKLTDAVSRPTIGTMAEQIKDIDDMVFALETFKKTLQKG